MCHKERVKNVKGERIVPEFSLVAFVAFFPVRLKKVAAKIYKFLGQQRYHDLLMRSKRMTTSQFLYFRE